MINTKLGFLVMALALGFSFASMPQAGNAQSDKENKERKVEREDDGDDDDVNETEAKSVKVSMETARSIALEKVPGTIIDAELEKERGRIQYAMDIRDANGKIFDVEIDANTGEILQAIEDDDDDDDDRRASSKAVRKKTAEREGKAERDAKVSKAKPQ